MSYKGDNCKICDAETARSQIDGEGPYIDAHIVFGARDFSETKEVTWVTHETNPATGETTVTLGFGDGHGNNVEIEA